MRLIAFGVWWLLVILVAGFSRVGVWFAVWVYGFGDLLCLVLTFWVLLWLLCFGNRCVCGVDGIAMMWVWWLWCFAACCICYVL